jgi:PAS domain S-box-containing protein
MRSPGLVIGMRANGEEFHSEASISHVRVGERSFYTVIMRDVTARLAAEARISRLTNLHAAQSLANQAIVRGRDWSELCQQICRIVVEQGHLHSALIRIPDDDRQLLQPYVEFGPQGSGIGAEAVTITDHHPAAMAYRERRPMRVSDLRREKEFPVARRQAIAQGAASAIVLPILGQDGPLGTLSVFSEEESYFDAEFEHLLLDLADNLAYAWDKLRSESELRNSEERYRALFENSPDGLRIISEGRVIKVNPAYIRMFGENHTGQTIEQAVFAHLDEDTLTRVHERMQQVALNNTPAVPDVQMYRRADGVVIPVETTSAPFMLGQKLAHLTIFRDLRDQQERQRAQQAAETRYRSLVETSLSGIALACDDKIEYANKAMARMFGLDQATQLEGRALWDLIDPAFQTVSIERLHALAATPGAVFPHGRLRLRTVGGDSIEVDLAAASVELDGRTMVLLEMRDVTREVIAKKGLRELNRNLENRVAQRTAELVSVNREMANVNRDLESFSYSVAHDLRAPLRHMAGFAHMIQMDVTEKHFDELPAHVERIVGGVKRMTGLIDGLLAVSRVAHVALNEESIDLAALVREIVVELDAGAAVRWNISDLPAMRADKVLLRQVWTNLLSNAIKYSAKADSPHIVVHTLQLGNEQVFSVRDNGAGFDPAQAAALFGVFKRLHSQQEFVGTGVGLAIVRRIVERHGGRIWADGTPGEGATFSFSLPLERVVALQSLAKDISQA